MSTQDLLIGLLIVAVVVILVLAYLYLSRTGREVQAQAAWREKELSRIREEQIQVANKDALAQLQNWRQKELELARGNS